MILTVLEKEARKNRIMEACFECYCEHGLNDTGIKALGKACGMNHSSFYNYFESLDELIVQSTSYCMGNVADELMAHALSYCPEDKPVLPETVIKFMHEMPQWISEHYGAKYRFMYQVYSSPKYLENGKVFFAEANRRYARYAQELAPRLGLPKETMQSIILSFARAATHYVMFEDADCLNLQIDLLAGLLLPEKK